MLVWSFIRSYQIPYCSLYNNGYTSIGLRHNTKKHESLKVSTSNNSDNHSDNDNTASTSECSNYLPAYHLSDNFDERESRVENSTNHNSNNSNTNSTSTSNSTFLSYSTIIIIYDTAMNLLQNRLTHHLSLLQQQLESSSQQSHPSIILLHSSSISIELRKQLDISTKSNESRIGNIFIYGELLPTGREY